MKTKHPTRISGLLLSTSAALLALAAPASAAPTVNAAFEYTPAAPTAGQSIALQATTTTNPMSPVQHAWDLDNDGDFDDAAGETASVKFDDKGPHVVRLRAQHVSTAGGVTEDIEQQTIQVGDAAPPSENPPPAENPPADNPPPPSGQNQAPTARYERSCGKQGTLVVCPGLVAYEDNPFELDASPSTDTDGQIVRYEWDLDGNGSFEKDAQSSPTLRHTFTESDTLIAVNTRKVSVRVTDDKGATATDTVTLKLREPQCQPLAAGGDLEIRGECIVGRDKKDSNGKRVRRLTSTEAVTINGITLVPAKGKSVIVDIPQTTVLAFPHIYSNRAAVSMPADSSVLALYDGKIDWKVYKHELRGFELAPNTKLNGLKVTSLAGLPKVALGRSSLQAYVALPSQFGGATSNTPLKLKAGGSLKKSGAERPLHFSVPNASLGPIGLDHLDVSFDGIDLWEVKAGVALPAPADVRIDGDAGIRSNGDFDHAGASLDFGAGIEIGGPVPLFLKRIAFRVEVNPKKSQCVPHYGVEPNPNPLPFEVQGWPKTIDYGIPTFALCGEVRFTGGPTILGAAALGLDGRLGFATYDDRPWVLRAAGEIQVVEIPVAKGEVAVHGDGYIRLHGSYRWGIPDVFTIRGSTNLELFKKKFNAGASGDACLEFIDLCRGFRGIISSKGIAVCFKFDYEISTWEPGIGYVWGEATPDLYFDGCDIGDYREHIKRPAGSKRKLLAAGAGTQDVELPAGLPGAVIAVEGADAAPLVAFVGPNGERIETPRDAKYIDDKRGLLLKDERNKTTQLAIPNPSAGKWRVEVLEGSSAVVSVKSAEGLPEPKVDAQVVGTGAQRDLRWKVEPREGQTVSFVERGPSGGAEIAVAKSDQGSVRFTPAEGASEKREIVAVVEQDGRPRGEYVVADYKAPGSSKPARPSGLKVKRSKQAVTASWKGAARTDTYEVRARLSDGRTIVRKTTRRKLVLRGIGVRPTGQVSVRAISASGLVGPAKAIRLRPATGR